MYDVVAVNVWIHHRLSVSAAQGVFQLTHCIYCRIAIYLYCKGTVTSSSLSFRFRVFNMGNTFRNINVSLAGDFGPKGDKIKQWVEANGGTFSKELNEEVTHVISTQNAYRKKVAAGMFYQFRPAGASFSDGRHMHMLTGKHSPRCNSHETGQDRIDRLA